MNIKHRLETLNAKGFGFGYTVWEDPAGGWSGFIEWQETDGQELRTYTSPTRHGKTEDGALRKCLSAWPLANDSFPWLPVPLTAAMAILEDEIDELTTQINYLIQERGV